MSEPSDFTPYVPERRAEPLRPATPGRLLGRAHNVQLRQERINANANLTVLSLRLVETPDGQPADVELRGRTLSGSVHDGDWVELAAHRETSGRYEPIRLDNLTTGATVTVTGSPHSTSARVSRVMALVMLAVLLVVFVVLFAAITGLT